MKIGIIEKVCPADYFVVRYDDGDCAAFQNSSRIQLQAGDLVSAEFNQVGPMSMKHIQQNKAFIVFSHTGQSCLIACVMLIEDFLKKAVYVKRACEMFYRESAGSLQMS